MPQKNFNGRGPNADVANPPSARRITQMLPSKGKATFGLLSYRQSKKTANKNGENL
jgi:hypothetical protein